MRFRLAAILVWLVLVADYLSASSGSRVRFDPDDWVKAKVDALVIAARAAYESDKALGSYRQELKSISQTIRRRKLSGNVSFAAGYPEFLEYVKAASLDQQPGHQLGFVVPDKQYFAETRQYVQIPDFLMSQSFLRAVSRYETMESAKRYLRKLNRARHASEQLVFFSFTSRHLGAPDKDDSYERLLVVVPGNVEEGIPEKWVQFAVTDRRSRKRVRNVSVVSALLGDGGTFNAYFKDYFRTYRADGSISVKGRWELGHGDDNCVRCHKSGVLPIFPEAGSVNPSEQQALVAVNQRFLTYGAARFDKYLDLRKLGPGLSSANATERSWRFGEEFAASEVGRSMACSNCHNNEGLGPLNWPMDRVLISSYIKGGRMPAGYNLGAPQREEVHARLIQEYFSIDDDNPGILKSWLLGKRR